MSRAMTFDLDLYPQGYLAVTLPISWIIFICGTNISHWGCRWGEGVVTHNFLFIPRDLPDMDVLILL